MTVSYHLRVYFDNIPLGHERQFILYRDGEGECTKSRDVYLEKHVVVGGIQRDGKPYEPAPCYKLRTK